MSKENFKNLSIALCGFTIIVLISFFLTTDAISENSNKSQDVIRKVEPQYVCMVNNKLFTEKQIPVVHEDKTYYGCCEMCEKRLRTDNHVRKAKDPVSGNEVDKADSVVAATSDGKVFYFENEDNLEKYSKKLNN